MKFCAPCWWWFGCWVLSDSLRPHEPTAARQASLSFTISWSLLRLVSIDPEMPSNHLILCRPLLLLPSVSPSIRVFSSELSFHIRWPQYWSFSFSPSSEYSGLISFRMDWFGLVVQGTLKKLLQHHSSKAPVLPCSAFLMVQLSHGHISWIFQRVWEHFAGKQFLCCREKKPMRFTKWSNLVWILPSERSLGPDFYLPLWRLDFRHH